MPEIIDISGLNGSRPGCSPAERVSARLELLKRWDKEGVPAEHLSGLPKSLRQAKAWHLPEVGIEQIKNPNDFTCTHKDWGSKVAEIDVILKRLQTRYKLPKQKRSARREAASSRSEAKLLTALLVRVTSQWHAAREATRTAVDDAEYQKGRAGDLAEQLSRKTEEVKALELDLAAVRRATRTLEAVPRIGSRERSTAELTEQLGRATERADGLSRELTAMREKLRTLEEVIRLNKP